LARCEGPFPQLERVLERFDVVCVSMSESGCAFDSVSMCESGKTVVCPAVVDPSPDVHVETPDTHPFDGRAALLTVVLPSVIEPATDAEISESASTKSQSAI